MAALETIDILKRDNASVLLEILSQCGTMKKGSCCNGVEVGVKSLLKLGRHIFNVTKHNLSCVREFLLRHCETIKGQPPEVLIDSEWTRITALYKDPRFVPKSRLRGAPADRDKAFQQRQEKALITTINSSQGITLPNVQFKITYAEQAPDIGPHGKENLVDVVIFDMHKQTFNVSCKQTNAADLGGGGISGLIKTVPKLVEQLYSTAVYDLQSMGFIQGQTYNVNAIPQIQYQIPPKFTYKIFRGSESVGGTIDYMYIGPAEVVLVNGTLNGMFIPIAEYARKKTYYFRLRKRDVFDNVVCVDYEKLNINGFPVIFTSGPVNSPAARFVVEDRVLSTSIVKEIPDE